MHKNKPAVHVGNVPGTVVQHDFAEASCFTVIEFNSADHSGNLLNTPGKRKHFLSRFSTPPRVRPRRTLPNTTVSNAFVSVNNSGNATSAANDLASSHAVGQTTTEPAKDEKRVTWINVDGLADIQLLHALGDSLGLHPLALEDVVNVHQHAKTETYDNNIFMVVRMPHDGEKFSTEQVSLFLLDGIVLTLQESEGDCLNPVRERLEGNKGRIRMRGADYLAYAIIDAIIDSYFPLLDKYDQTLTGISDELDDGLPDDVPKRLHNIRANLLAVRKVAQQHRDAVSSLVREPSTLVTDETQLFLRDCLDHIGRLIETADTYRETCGELRELYFAQLGQKTNDVMKVLTMVATIFIPMSFIAGVYGMNFDSSVSPLNMPELHWALGYPFAILLMLCTGGGLLFYLKRNGWL